MSAALFILLWIFLRRPFDRERDLVVVKPWRVTNYPPNMRRKGRHW